MADDLKHLDEHSNEIHELVETLVQNHLLEAANANQYCPKCVAVILLLNTFSEPAPGSPASGVRFASTTDQFTHGPYHRRAGRRALRCAAPMMRSTCARESLSCRAMAAGLTPASNAAWMILC